VAGIFFLPVVNPPILFPPWPLPRLRLFPSSSCPALSLQFSQKKLWSHEAIFFFRFGLCPPVSPLFFLIFLPPPLLPQIFLTVTYTGRGGVEHAPFCFSSKRSFSTLAAPPPLSTPFFVLILSARVVFWVSAFSAPCYAFFLSELCHPSLYTLCCPALVRSASPPSRPWAPPSRLFTPIHCLFFESLTFAGAIPSF